MDCDQNIEHDKLDQLYSLFLLEKTWQFNQNKAEIQFLPEILE